MLNPVQDIFRQNNPYESLITAILIAEEQPLLALDEKVASFRRDKDILDDLDSSVSSFHTLLTDFTDSLSNPFGARSAAVPESSGYSATATDDAALGTHAIQVQRLASTDTRISQQYTSAGTSLRTFFDTNGQQAFDISVASPIDGDENRRVDVNVSINPTGSTDEEILAEISTAINDAMSAALEGESIESGDGALASVVNETSDTARLSLRSGDTGFASRLQFTDSANGLLAALGVTNASVASGTSGGMVVDVGTSETDSNLNAQFQLDGLTLYRSSNQVSDALAGVTLNLSSVMTSSNDFTIEPDRDSIKEQVNSFVSQYNDLLGFLKDRTTVDGELGTRASFAGDPTFTNLRFNMRNTVAAQVSGQPSGAPSYLTDLGIEIGNDGKLSLTDEDALIAAVEQNPDAVADLFAGDNGIATQLETTLDQYLGADGIIDNRIDVFDNRITSVNRQITAFEDRLAQREEQLRAQFAAVQETIALLQGQSQFLGAFGGSSF